MKKFFLSAAFSILATTAFCAVTVQYENQDHKGYIMKVKIDGEYKQVKFENYTSASLTIPGSNNGCYIITGCGEVEVNEGDKIVVKDRCVTVYRSLQQNYTRWTNY
ncbi:MAG: hypothetical protein IAE95_00495 [Chitinophagaceae bacterium]|jgi:hypothetical protein|nr:hypothetical protein [Chitinophagaceae bacterium]